MTYCTHFYAECPATAMDIEIEIIFTCEEEEETEIFWGYPVNMPASGEVEIVEVFKDGKKWMDYSDVITTELHNHEWTKCAEIKRRTGQCPISKIKKILPCKRQLAA
jgi:hypothetical protein